MKKDEIKAYQYQYSAHIALRDLLEEQKPAYSDVMKLANYVEALEATLSEINKYAQEMSYHIGSEYTEVSGTYRIIRQMKERIDSEWEAYKAERKEKLELQRQLNALQK